MVKSSTGTSFVHSCVFLSVVCGCLALKIVGEGAKAPFAKCGGSIVDVAEPIMFKTC